MRVVIVGATGNIGQRLVQRLADEPSVSEVRGLSRREPQAWPAQAEWARLDVSLPVSPRLFTGADVVVHLAWLFQPTHRPGVTWAANVEGTARVLHAVQEAEVPTLVLGSSVGAYSPRTSTERVDESWPTHGFPTAAYSREKAYVERLLDVFEHEHPEKRVVRLRPGFSFRRESAVQQRRLFAGPFVPAKLFRKVRVPVLPDPGGLEFQAVHTDDVVQGYTRAVLSGARGAFNIAADPVLTMPRIAEMLGVPVVKVPAGPVRAGLWAAWAAHLVPASPGLFDLISAVPLMRTDRARDQLGWEPVYDSTQALREVLEGIEEPAGAPTPPLAPSTSGPGRRHEVTTGLGERP